MSTALTKEQVDVFQGAMLAAGKGVAVEQKTLSALSKSLIMIDLAAMLPMNGLALGPVLYFREQSDQFERMLTITHETAHLFQFWKNPLAMDWLYVMEPEARVAYEAEAKRASLEVMHAFGAPLPTEQQLEAGLRSGYNLRDQDIVLGMQLLERAMTSVQAGIVSTEAATHAIRILKGLGVFLRASVY